MPASPNKPPLFAFVVPCYNESSTLPSTFIALGQELARLREKGSIAPESCVLYVDDGSSDATWQMLQEQASRDVGCKAIKLAGNVGHQMALYAGMMQALVWNVDVLVSIDADLQDDLSVVDAMLEAWEQGSAIVYGVKQSRAGDSAFKTATASAFYRLMQRLGVNLVEQHADFRLVSRPVLEALSQCKENALFLRGLLPLLGFTSSSVHYAIRPRMHGTTTYTLRRMVSLALNGLTSFSTVPLRFAAVLSLVTFAAAIIHTFVVLAAYFSGNAVPGWSSLMIMVMMLSSVQLLCLAIIGEYVGRIFMQTKNRPRYIIEKIL